jgi:RNA polymerase sigma-70 factor (ECF subfamily)
MSRPELETAELVSRVAGGDSSAVEQLFAKHRDRLRRMVLVHMDRPLTVRVDPSDVVQEAFVEASRRIADYLREQPVAFYPWLRQIAWERLVKLRRRHVAAQRRSVLREVRWDTDLPDESAMALANRLVDTGASPTQKLARDEMRRRVRSALREVPVRQRQVLVLRYLEQLSVSEVAEVLGITEAACMKRHVRAIQRLRTLLDQQAES